MEKQASSKVIEDLSEDKAKRDASYEYGKGSKEPIAEGAFKGALASGLASRFIPAKKKSGRLNWKAHAVNLAIGVIAGGMAGKKYNDDKVEKAQKARRWLSDKKKEKKYIGAVKDIYKESSYTYDNKIEDIKNDPYGSVVAAAEDAKPKKIGIKEGIMDTIGGIGLGAAIGLLTKGKARGLSIKRGASIGGAGTAASDIMDSSSNESGLTNSRAGQVAGMGASFAAAGAIEPIVNRALGRYSRDKYSIKSEFDKIKKGEPVTDFIKGHQSKGKGIKYMFKGVGKNTLKSAGKYGAIGLLAGGAIDYLTHSKKKDIGKTASVQISADEAILAKEYDAENTLKGSIVKDAIVNSAVAGLGYVASRYIFGNANAGKAAKAALGYVGGKTIYDLGKRHNAKSYLKKSKSGKLSDLRSEVEENAIRPSNIYEAVVLNNILGNMISNDYHSETKATSTKRFEL